MPFSGTGTFTLVSGNPVVTGTNISSTVQNNTMSDFANGFTNCITRDGQSPPTSNLPMGNQRHTGASNASGAGEYLVYGQNIIAGSVVASSVTTTGNATIGGDAQLNGATSMASLTVSPGATELSALDVNGVANFDSNPTGRIAPLVYTPTVTNAANTSAGVSNGTWKGHRIGNVVSFSGSVNFTITNSSTATRLRVSLPVASTFAATTDAAGTGISSLTTAAGMPGPAVYANTATADLRIESTSGSSSAGATMTVWVTGHYEVI